MSSVGFRVDEEQVAEMVKVADSNNTGTIELNEFLNLMVGQLRDKHTKHEYARKFQIFDRNNDGYISEAEIRRVTDVLGVNLYPDQIQTLIKEADKNHDGKISYKEYVNYMVNGKGINKYWKSTDEMLASLNNLWLMTDDPMATNWDRIRQAKYWDIERYQEAYGGLALMFVCLCITPKLWRRCCRNKNYERQIDDKKEEGLEFRSTRSQYASSSGPNSSKRENKVLK